MQLTLALPEPSPPQPVPEVEIDAQARRTAQEVLARILAQAAGAAKPEEPSNE